jgi:hypothetical protein
MGKLVYLLLGVLLVWAYEKGWLKSFITSVTAGSKQPAKVPPYRNVVTPGQTAIETAVTPGTQKPTTYVQFGTSEPGTIFDRITGNWVPADVRLVNAQTTLGQIAVDPPLGAHRGLIV